MAEDGKPEAKSAPEAFAEGAEKGHKVLETLHGLAEKAHKVYETYKLYSPDVKNAAVDKIYNLKDAFGAATEAGKETLPGQFLEKSGKALGHIGNAITLATAVPHMGHGLYKMATGNNTEMEAGMRETFKGSYSLLAGAAGPAGAAVDKIGTHAVKALGYKGDLGDFVAETGQKTVYKGFDEALAEARGIGGGLKKAMHGEFKEGLKEAGLAVLQHDAVFNGGLVKTPLDNLSLADARKNVIDYEKKLEGKVVEGVHTAKEIAHKAVDVAHKVEDKAVDIAHKVEDKAVDLAKRAESKVADVAHKVEDKVAEIATKAETKVTEVAAKVIPPDVADQAKADYHAAMAKPGVLDKLEGLGQGARNFVRGVGAHAF